MTQCDGVRPSCQTCRGRETSCTYDADPDATPIIALKRKYEQLQQQSYGNDQLVDALRTRSEAEATSILKRLRRGEDIANTLTLPIDGRKFQARRTEAPTPDGSASAGTTLLPSFSVLTQQLSRSRSPTPPSPLQSQPPQLDGDQRRHAWLAHRALDQDRDSGPQRNRLPFTKL